MRVALVNPPRNFEGSIYFGFREPHLPLELGYAKALLQAAGHDVPLPDAHLCGQDMLAADVADGCVSEMTAVATAPSYLLRRCAQPELRISREFLLAQGSHGDQTVAVGLHGSEAPGAALRWPEEWALRGSVDGDAWERTHAYYLAQFGSFSDIQEERPRAQAELEAVCPR